MSHLHEREEKVCLNCGAKLIGRYCQDCGQENLEPKESAWHLIVHFFNDFTHFDGKLFSTLKPLFLKPGFLTEEYMKGRRAAYLNPVRMYIFISAVFFLIFTSFLLPKPTKSVKLDENGAVIRRKNVTVSIGRSMTELGQQLDSTKIRNPPRTIVLGNGDNISGFWLDNWRPQSVAAYDSLQELLPRKEKDNWFNRYYAHKSIEGFNYFSQHKEEATKHIFKSFLHSLPYMLFFTLPVLALILNLLYIRRRKEFIYVSHGIFIIHFFCVMFLTALVMFACNKYLPFGGLLYTIILVGLYIYLYQAMRYFYKQGWLKTLIKFLLFWILGLGVLILLFAIGILNSTINAAPH